MVGIDLFAGAGGMSLGAAAAGVDVVLAIEADPHAAITYQHNHPDTVVLNRDIRSVEKADIISIRRKNGGSIVFGGPPCQGFSYSNSRTRKAENANNWLFLEFIRIVKLWEPDFVVFENVKGITNTAGGVFLQTVLQHLQDCKYTVASGVLDAVKFGVPQHRERLFIVGTRHRVTPSLPIGSDATAVPVWDAISDLPRLKNGASDEWQPYRCPPRSKYGRTMRGRLTRSSGHLLTRNATYVLERYNHIPQGGNWENIPAKLMRNYSDRSRCHTGIYHRLWAHKPSVVIGNYRKNMLVHPWQNRGLSVRETARIQSFPDWYEFKGSVGFQQQQVGNAVPPMLAEHVFKHLLKVC